MNVREYDLRLLEQVELSRQEALTARETVALQHQALDSCIKHELGSVRNLSTKVCESVGRLRESMETSFSILDDAVQKSRASTNAVQEWNENYYVTLRHMNDEVRSAVANANDNTLRGTTAIKAILNRSLKLQTQDMRSQKKASLRIQQDLMRIQSMLAQFIVSNTSNNELEADYCRIEAVDVATVMMPLMLMSSHMPLMLNKLADQQSLGLGREEIEMFHKEFNQLLAASHEASAKALRGGLLPITSTCSRSTLKRRNQYENLMLSSSKKKRRLRNFRHNSSIKTQRKVWSQSSTTGELSIVVEAQEKVRCRSPSVVFTAFFVPRPDICSTGLLAILKRVVTKASAPKISRFMRSFNLMHGNIVPAQVACMGNDVEALQAMLSAREITPWDRNEHGWTLLLVSISNSKYFRIK